MKDKKYKSMQKQHVKCNRKSVSHPEVRFIENSPTKSPFETYTKAITIFVIRPLREIYTSVLNTQKFINVILFPELTKNW